MRRTMAREGRAITVYSEADDGPTWSRVLAAGAPEYGWVDGHACYGAADALGPGSARVTLLREPVRRLVSVFHYNALVHPRQFPFATLEEFVESEAARGFTQVAGLARCAGHAIDGLPDADVGAIAERELAQSYAVVGTTERFEETIFLLCVLAGLDAIGMWWRILAAPKAVDVEQLPARLRARIEQVVEHDLRLYDRVETALCDRVASCGFGDALVRYKEAAAREPVLSDHDKFVECLRWRQVLAEAELAACRPR